MRAVSIDYKKRSLRERDLPDPSAPGPDQVLFRILEVGVCGTDRDLAAMKFGHGPAGDDFLVLGHEALGEVLAVGQSVTDFAPGDLIVPSVRRACTPACSSCARGRRDLCITLQYTERGITGMHGYFTEAAVDAASDLVRVDPALRDTAVLIEPLSVVEKAVSMAQSLHLGEPRRALVLGAGTVGLLAACVLQFRGFEVDVVSTEPRDSGRARLASAIGTRYTERTPDRKVDIIIEAAGSPAAANTGLGALAPLGVMIILGAHSTAAAPSFFDLIVGNQVIAGSVNASPEALAAAARDIGHLPRELTSHLIERTRFGEFERTLAGPPLHVPKVVHVVD